MSATVGRRRASGRRGMILDLFSGAGGWAQALRSPGLSATGIESDPWACATARAAGHECLQADVTKLDPHAFAPVWGLVGSPPCQAYSKAGKNLGRADKPHVIACAHGLAVGDDSRAAHARRCRDPRSLLSVEPLRYTLALRPRWVALEQVPAVIELWRLLAELLGACGYHTATGILSAERYGVPQTRKRAFLIASRDGPVQLPAPTHRSYHPRRAETPQHEQTLKPWVSMAQALGWGMTARPAMTVVAGNKRGGTGALQRLARERRRGAWTACRPATTIACDRRIHPPGHKQCSKDPPGRYQQRRGQHAIRVTVQQAAILQGLPAGYPWHGPLTRQYTQVGNAVPPPLARAVIEQALKPSPPRSGCGSPSIGRLGKPSARRW